MRYKAIDLIYKTDNKIPNRIGFEKKNESISIYSALDAWEIDSDDNLILSKQSHGISIFSPRLAPTKNRVL